jgi:hypothetical protein
MFSRSMTSGTTATTRVSTAAVVHVVHPRFDPPATTKRETVELPPASDAANAVTASIARTALLVMGRRAGHFSSPVRRNLSQVYAMKSSSSRGLRAGSSMNTIG